MHLAQRLGDIYDLGNAFLGCLVGHHVLRRDGAADPQGFGALRHMIRYCYAILDRELGYFGFEAEFFGQRQVKDQPADTGATVG